MQALKLILVMVIVLGMPGHAVAEDVLNVGGFSGLGVATDVANRKGYFNAEDIDFRFDSVESSEELLTKFADGSYDMVQTNADNIIAWIEGQGPDRQRHDNFVMVMGGYSGLASMEFTVAPGIGSYEDLRGKALAVDAIDTGYAPVLVYMLRQNGLVWKQDYTLVSAGGGSLRKESMLSGETVGGLVTLDGELKQAGFRRLDQSINYVNDYARGMTAVRREWAERHGDLLVRYIRAMIVSINWLLDPRNKLEALDIIMDTQGASLAEARRIYEEEGVDPTTGFIPSGRIDPSGIEQIIRIREVMGQFEPPLPSPEKYIETRFYREAIDSLAR